MDKYEHIKKSKKEIFFNNLIGGIGWALGATVGLAVLFAFLGFIIQNKINLVPVVGNFVADVARFVLQNNPNLVK